MAESDFAREPKNKPASPNTTTHLFDHVEFYFRTSRYTLLLWQLKNGYVGKAYVAGIEDYQYLLTILEKATLLQIVTFFIKHAMTVALLVEELPKLIHSQEMFHHLHLQGFQGRSAENANVNGHYHGLWIILGKNAQNANSVED